MITYSFLQHYWWAIISILAGILAFMLFVQGANSLMIFACRNDDEYKLIVNSTGRKWELTFTTLVVFGGAFFASFPLFYSTSFSGAYWVWIALLLCFVVQAVSYEYQSKEGNVFGKKFFRIVLFVTGILSPFLIGTAISTFFFGAPFSINKNALGNEFAPTISTWESEWRGLEALWSPCFNMVLGVTLLLLSRCLGALYLINNIMHKELSQRIRRILLSNAIWFVVFFVVFLLNILTMDGYQIQSDLHTITSVPYKYLNNLLEMPLVLGIFIIGVGLVLWGLGRSIFNIFYSKGIWFVGPGVVLIVTSLFMILGYNNTPYYPSSVNPQDSLTIFNSSSSEFTLFTMSIVSLIIPFVIGYIAYSWKSMDKKSLTVYEVTHSEHTY